MGGWEGVPCLPSERVSLLLGPCGGRACVFSLGGSRSLSLFLGASPLALAFGLFFLPGRSPPEVRGGRGQPKEAGRNPLRLLAVVGLLWEGAGLWSGGGVAWVAGWWAFLGGVCAWALPRNFPRKRGAPRHTLASHTNSTPPVSRRRGLVFRPSPARGRTFTHLCISPPPACCVRAAGGPSLHLYSLGAGP